MKFTISSCVGVQLQQLRQEVETLKAQATAVNVETSLAQVRQLASAPTRLRDPSAIMAALQKLADDARTVGHDKAAEFEAILRQVRPHIYSPQFGDIIIRLVGSKEESKIATAIAKMVKQQSSYAGPYPRSLMRNRGNAPRGRMACFKCGQRGHFQRHCPNNR
jgi:hypothetical protein